MLANETRPSAPGGPPCPERERTSRLGRPTGKRHTPRIKEGHCIASGKAALFALNHRVEGQHVWRPNLVLADAAYQSVAVGDQPIDGPPAGRHLEGDVAEPQLVGHRGPVNPARCRA